MFDHFLCRGAVEDRLDVYIYDYLVKRNLHASARAFQAEGNVSRDPVAIDAPAGFLFEWWSVFWDIFIARTDLKHSEAAASYIESQQNKAREMQKQQEQEHQKSQLHQQIQMQHSMQRHAQQQQQHRVGIQLASGSTSGPVSNDSLTAANASATNIYERLKPPLQRETLNDAAIKQKLGGNVSQFLDPSHVSLLKGSVATTGGLPTGQTLLGTSSGLLGNLQQVQARNQQLSTSTQDMKSNINPLMSSRVPEESLIGGSSQGGGNLTLKGWPLAGLDQLRSGLLQQNALMQSMHSFNQLPAQQNSAAQSLTVTDMENRRLSILLNNQNMSLGKDSPISDILLKQQVQKSSQLPQQYSQHPISSQQSEQQGKMVGSGSTIADGSMSGAFHGNNQVTKNQNGRKRKQASSSGPTNSSGTANTTGPSAGSPSTPSTHTAGDVMSVPTLQQSVPSSKSLLVFGSDSLGSLTSAQNQLADMDRLVIDGSFGDNVDSFLSPDDVDTGDGVAHQQDVGKGFSLKELNPIMASTHRVECCDFSSDGKLLATGGYDSKVSLWCTESFNLRSTLEEHSQEITDVRFSPSMSRVATSSADKTVRIWDADNPGYSLRTFTGHLSAVTSLDFHPSKEDLICSCDNNSEIRYWSIKNGSCAGVFKGGATQMRFQPGLGSLLAAAVDNFISILDVETQICRFKLQGHKNLVHSVCWDFSGKYLASVSDESVRVWTFGSSVKAECIHELVASGNKFSTCVFHPSYPWLIIGGYETLELWNFREDKTTTLHAHDKLVTSLAASKVTGLIASASHDRRVKFWK